MALPELLHDETHVIDIPAGACEISLPPEVTRFELRFDEHNSLGNAVLTGEVLIGGAIIINQIKFGKKINASVSFSVRWRQ